MGRFFNCKISISQLIITSNNASAQSNEEQLITLNLVKERL